MKNVKNMIVKNISMNKSYDAKDLHKIYTTAT